MSIISPSCSTSGWAYESGLEDFRRTVYVAWEDFQDGIFGLRQILVRTSDDAGASFDPVGACFYDQREKPANSAIDVPKRRAPAAIRLATRAIP